MRAARIMENTNLHLRISFQWTWPKLVFIISCGINVPISIIFSDCAQLFRCRKGGLFPSRQRFFKVSDTEKGRNDWFEVILKIDWLNWCNKKTKVDKVESEARRELIGRNEVQWTELFEVRIPKQWKYLEKYSGRIAGFSTKAIVQVHDFGGKVSGDDVVQHLIMEQVARWRGEGHWTWEIREIKRPGRCLMWGPPGCWHCLGQGRHRKMEGGESSVKSY